MAKRSKSKILKDKCDKLWSEIIKLRAGYKSELTGSPGYMGKAGIIGLQSHHIIGKANYFMRYNLENGICLTDKQHIYQAHHQNRVEKFRHEVILLKGYDIFEYLWEEYRKNINTHVDLNDVYDRLMKEKERLK